MKVALVVIVLALAGFAGYKYFWPQTLPNIVLKDNQGKTVDLAAMHNGKRNLVMVVMLPNCPISRYSLGVVQEQHKLHGGRVAFAGLMFTNQAEAEGFRVTNKLAFPVYGLRDAPDPHLLNAFVKEVGTNNKIWGGTVLVVDHKGTIEEQLEKEEVKALPQLMASY
jgi:hypothetical protein